MADEGWRMRKDGTMFRNCVTQSVTSRVIESQR